MILFILPLFSGGGAERVTLNLLRELYNCNYSVGIIVFDKSGPLLSMVPNGVPIYNLGTSTLRRSIFPLVRKIQKIKPKVLFSTLGYINVVILSVRWFIPKKTKIWVREANIPSISLKNNAFPKLMMFFYQALYKKSDSVICSSIKMRDEFVSHFSVPKSIINVLPNLIDIQKIRSSALPMKRFDKGGVCYISSGRLTFQKGFDRLLYWFSELDNKKSTLTILGEGHLKDKLIELVVSLNIKDRVSFRGFCTNPWQLYAGADVFLLPSRWEGMSNSVLEALACGIPVIATKESGGISELALQSKFGAISVVDVYNDEFLLLMGSVIASSSTTLRESLLPPMYEVDTVIQTFTKWIDED